MDISYQKLLPKHVNEYRDIRLESLKLHPEHFSSKYEDQVKLPELGLEAIIKKQDKNKFVLGALAGEKLIGICAFMPHNDFNLGQTGTLIQMYVKKAFSGKKIGLGLTQTLVTEALNLADISGVMLEVNPENARAIRVYEQAGFKVFMPQTSEQAGKEMFMLFDSSSLVDKS